MQYLIWSAPRPLGSMNITLSVAWSVLVDPAGALEEVLADPDGGNVLDGLVGRPRNVLGRTGL